MATPERFPFLRLPAYFQNQVYDFLLAFKDQQPNCRPFDPRAHQCLALTRACKQLQEEFRPLYWNNSSIYLRLAKPPPSQTPSPANFCPLFLSRKSG